MEWAEETIVRLRDLWAEGLSTAEIGRRLGVSKNAVVGKAHRLDLPARPSPIRREGEATAPRRAVPRCVTGTTLPPLSSDALPPPAVAPASVVRPAPFPPLAAAAPPAPPRPAPAPPAAARLQAVAPPRSYGRVVTCCWPIGEPGTPSFCFCDAPSEPGKPYCDEHAKLAYVKVRDRREDAA